MSTSTIMIKDLLFYINYFLPSRSFKADFKKKKILVVKERIKDLKIKKFLLRKKNCFYFKKKILLHQRKKFSTSYKKKNTCCQCCQGQGKKKKGIIEV